jgi:hypothetical protein
LTYLPFTLRIDSYLSEETAVSREYLVHIREPLTAERRTALTAAFPASRRSAKPQLLFLAGPADGSGGRAIVDHARGLGLHARVVDL